MKIGILGATGYIGLNLFQKLNSHHDLIGICLNKKKHYGFNIKNVDILNKDLLRPYLIDCEILIHLAYIPPRWMEGNFRNSYDVNVKGTRNIIEICQESSIPLIFTSSIAVLGTLFKIPADELCPYMPMNDYTRMKIINELEIMLRLEKFYILRVSNVSGIYKIDEEIKSKKSLINIFSESVLLNKPISIHGNGTQKRDFIKLSDLTHIIQSFVENNYPYGVYNIGSGYSHSINEVSDNICSHAKKLGIIPQKNMVSEDMGVDSETYEISIEKMKNVTGFQPHDLDDIINENFKMYLEMKKW
tara:strand:+ start:3004 stop:3909 length:906 start_codon:yes stop_codon:yes gene_type:complete